MNNSVHQIPASPLYPNIKIPAPSAPPMDPVIACQVKWENLPVIKTAPNFFQKQENRQAIQKWSFRLSVPSFAGTLYTGIWFTAKPIVVLGAFSSFGFVTLALVATTVALRYLKPSPLDYGVRSDMRREAMNAYKSDDLKFDKMQTYGETIITNTELQEILYCDITKLTYNEFIQKHGRNCLSFLSADNKNALKRKYIAHLCERESGETGLKDILEKEMSKFFGVKFEELAGDFAALLVSHMYNNKLSYDEFIKRNSLKIIPYILGTSNGLWFIEQFRLNVVTKMNGKGGIAADIAFKEDFQAFGSEIRTYILREVVWNSLNEFHSGVINYEGLRSRNLLDHLKTLLDHYEAYCKSNNKFNDYKLALFNAYLALPYSLMKKYESDRELLEITPEQMKENLKNRWSGMTMPEILGNHDQSSDFFNSVADFLKPSSDWTAKVVADCSGMSVCDILMKSRESLSKSSRFLNSAMLTSQTVMSTGKKLCELLEDELRAYNTLEEVLKDYSYSDLYNLEVSSNPKLIALANDFMIRNPKEFNLKLTTRSSECVSFIISYVKIPEIARQAISNLQESFTMETRRSEDAERVARDLAKKNLTILENNRDLSIANARKLSQIDVVDAVYKQSIELQAKLENSKKAKERELQTLRDEHTATFSKIEELERNIVNYNSIKRDPTSVTHDIASLEMKESHLIKSLPELQKAVKSLLESKEVKESNNLVKTFESLQKFAALREELEKLAKEAVGFSAVKAELQTQNKKDQEGIDKPVTGVFQALPAFISQSSDRRHIKDNEARLAEISKKEERIKVLENQIQAFKENAEFKPFLELSRKEIDAMLAQHKQFTQQLENKIKQPVTNMQQELSRTKSALDSKRRALQQMTNNERNLQRDSALLDETRDRNTALGWTLIGAAEAEVETIKHQLARADAQCQALNNGVIAASSNFDGQKIQIELDFAAKKAEQEKEIQKAAGQRKTEHEGFIAQMHDQFVKQLQTVAKA